MDNLPQSQREVGPLLNDLDAGTLDPKLRLLRLTSVQTNRYPCSAMIKVFVGTTDDAALSSQSRTQNALAGLPGSHSQLMVSCTTRLAQRQNPSRFTTLHLVLFFVFNTIISLE